MDELNPAEDGAGPQGILSPPVSLWVLILVVVGVLLITVIQMVTRTLWFLFLTTDHLRPQFGHLLPFRCHFRSKSGLVLPHFGLFAPKFGSSLGFRDALDPALGPLSPFLATLDPNLSSVWPILATFDPNQPNFAQFWPF